MWKTHVWGLFSPRIFFSGEFFSRIWLCHTVSMSPAISLANRAIATTVKTTTGALCKNVTTKRPHFLKTLCRSFHGHGHLKTTALFSFLFRPCSFQFSYRSFYERGSKAIDIKPQNTRTTNPKKSLVILQSFYSDIVAQNNYGHFLGRLGRKQRSTLILKQDSILQK